jgi:hypothetical protein
LTEKPDGGWSEGGRVEGWKDGKVERWKGGRVEGRKGEGQKGRHKSDIAWRSRYIAYLHGMEIHCIYAIEFKRRINLVSVLQYA